MTVSAPILVLLNRRQGQRRTCKALTTAQAKQEFDYDLLIIGCGVGGHGAALHAVECVSLHPIISSLVCQARRIFMSTLH